MARYVDVEREEVLREIQRQYAGFIDDRTGSGTYYGQMQDMITDNRRRLLVNVNDLRCSNPERALGLLTNSTEEIVCLENAFRDVAASIDPEYVKQQRQLFVGVEGSFGSRHVNPRTLKSHLLGNMVCCEGIVTKCSLIHPKVVRSVHYCPKTAKTVEKQYFDLTSNSALPTSSVYPTEDENNNPLETEYGLSTYKDHQTFTLQELPETAPSGQLPRSLDVIADDDLADCCKPGDRLRVVGIFRCLPSKQAGFTSCTFRTVLIANNVQLLSKEFTPVFRTTDVQHIRKFLLLKDRVVDVLAQSLAPSIYGHEEVKKAILCMLLGGMEKVLPNGTRLRGDINILLIGDPSVAKSQLLRYVLNIAPRAVCTTGRGSSGVGLTAAVTTDPQTGERRLEAGAMVLADHGIVCIDEFDKMTDMDRTTIHEVMEQGRVSISKAGIQATLNARCAVLAAANPVYGRYDESKSPMENIGMQDSLLSRFDLLFILLDEHSVERDSAVAEYVVKIHRFRPFGEEDGAVLESGNDIQSLTTFNVQQDDSDDADDAEIYERNVAWLPEASNRPACLTINFMRKYIQVARHVTPVFTDKAGAYIARKYADLRAFDDKQSDKEKTQPVTARMLETMIRLATAFAKARMAKTVTVRDAEQAFELLSFACHKKKSFERTESEKTPAKKRAKIGTEDSAADEDRSGTRSKDTAADDIYEFDSSDFEAGQFVSKRMSGTCLKRLPAEVPSFYRLRKQPTTSAEGQGAEETDADSSPAISIDRYAIFRRCLRKFFDKAHNEQAALEAMISDIQSQMSSNTFTPAEVSAACDRLCDENVLMISEGTAFLI